MCQGIPRRVVRQVDGAGHRVAVDVDGTEHEVSAAMMDGEDLPAGSWVVVHLGFAMERIDEREARAVLQELAELDDWYAAALDPHEKAETAE